MEPKPQPLRQHRRDLHSFARATQSRLARQQLAPIREVHRRTKRRHQNHCRRQNLHRLHRRCHRRRQNLHRLHRQNRSMRPGGEDDYGRRANPDDASYGRCWSQIRREVRRCRFARQYQQIR